MVDDRPDDLFPPSDRPANNSRPDRDTSVSRIGSRDRTTNLPNKNTLFVLAAASCSPPPPPQTPDAGDVVAEAAAQKSLFLFSAFPPKLKVRPNRTTPSIGSVSRRRSTERIGGRERGRLGGPCNYTSFLTPRPRPRRRRTAQGDVAQFLPDPWPNERIISSVGAELRFHIPLGCPATNRSPKGGGSNWCRLTTSQSSYVVM